MVAGRMRRAKTKGRRAKTKGGATATRRRGRQRGVRKCLLTSQMGVSRRRRKRRRGFRMGRMTRPKVCTHLVCMCMCAHVCV
jgi:hypothetical protein